LVNQPLVGFCQGSGSRYPSGVSLGAAFKHFIMC
jgi:hypothetical protein